MINKNFNKLFQNSKLAANKLKVNLNNRPEELSNETFYNIPQGATYEWVDRKIWHAGTNCGTVPKYIWNAW